MDQNVDFNTQAMQRCIDRSSKYLGFVSPNPVVGAAIYYNSRLIAEGEHEIFGGPHAEINALSKVQDNKLLARSTLLVSLEPCNHAGKTPACTQAILESGIKAVIVACRDPNSNVTGRGIEFLKSHGIHVQEGIANQAAIWANRRFFTHCLKNRPWVVLKWAETSDGFIAPLDRKPVLISSEESRALVHQWRGEESAVLIGTTTALMDDPALTVRYVKARNPIRVILDRTLRLPRTLKCFESSARTIVLHEVEGQTDGLEAYKISLTPESILLKLSELGINSVLIEGGAAVLNSFIEAGLWDEARVFKSDRKMSQGVKAPSFTNQPNSISDLDSDRLCYWLNSSSLNNLKQV